MKYEACETCPINDTCNLIKAGIETRCTLNAKYEKPWVFKKKEDTASDLSCPKELFVNTSDED